MWQQKITRNRTVTFCSRRSFRVRDTDYFFPQREFQDHKKKEPSRKARNFTVRENAKLFVLIFWGIQHECFFGTSQNTNEIAGYLKSYSPVLLNNWRKLPFLKICERKFTGKMLSPYLLKVGPWIRTYSMLYTCNKMQISHLSYYECPKKNDRLQ